MHKTLPEKKIEMNQNWERNIVSKSYRESG